VVARRSVNGDWWFRIPSVPHPMLDRRAMAQTGAIAVLVEEENRG
jgi:hypothetical protein